MIAFGIDQNLLMLMALVFFGASGLYYVWLWIDGFIKDGRTSEKVKQPWE